MRLQQVCEPGWLRELPSLHPFLRLLLQPATLCFWTLLFPSGVAAPHCCPGAVSKSQGRCSSPPTILFPLLRAGLLFSSWKGRPSARSSAGHDPQGTTVKGSEGRCLGLTARLLRGAEGGQEQAALQRGAPFCWFALCTLAPVPVLTLALPTGGLAPRKPRALRAMRGWLWLHLLIRGLCKAPALCHPAQTWAQGRLGPKPRSPRAFQLPGDALHADGPAEDHGHGVQ